MSPQAPEKYWRVAFGETPDTALHSDYDEQWDAVAYYNLRRVLTINRYDDSKDPTKRLEIMDNDMSTHWNCRAIHDGKEHNVWLWQMEVR